MRTTLSLCGNDGVTPCCSNAERCVLPSDLPHRVTSPLPHIAAFIPLTPAKSPPKQQPGTEEPKKGSKCLTNMLKIQVSDNWCNGSEKKTLCSYITSPSCRHPFGAHEPFVSAREAQIKNAPCFHYAIS